MSTTVIPHINKGGVGGRGGGEGGGGVGVQLLLPFVGIMYVGMVSVNLWFAPANT